KDVSNAWDKSPFFGHIIGHVLLPASVLGQGCVQNFLNSVWGGVWCGGFGVTCRQDLLPPNIHSTPPKEASSSFLLNPPPAFGGTSATWGGSLAPFDEFLLDELGDDAFELEALALSAEEGAV